MIDANGKLVVSSRILFAVERQREQRIHEQRLREIGQRRPRRRRDNKKGAKKRKKHGLARGIDNYVEQGKYDHILENRKGKYMKAREAEEVKRRGEEMVEAERAEKERLEAERLAEEEETARRIEYLGR